MKALLAVPFCLISFEASAQIADLSCSGKMHQYIPEHREGSISPGAARIDIEKRALATPVGDFRITHVHDNSISFDSLTDPLVVFGTLDRVTGAMTIFWRTQAEDAKLKAGLPHTVTRYADMACIPAKRMF